MKNTNKIILKIVAGVVAIALISGILFITNAFVGNPISAMMANRAIEKYVDENYSALDLIIAEARYNFKDASYVARAESRTSIDTKFAIYYRDGKVQRDDYKIHVLGMFNTLERLSDEYSTIAKEIVAKELGYENNTTMVMYDKEVYENANDVLELDMKFDKSLLLDTEVTIRLDLGANSLEGIAKVLTDAHKAFVNNGYNFKKYGLYAENNGTLVMVNGVTPADIQSGELITLLKEAKNSDSVGGISVFIKGENK
ncbi:hypothetical protein GOQ27_13350 [Clostridium sp. D2Q-11]|uniref:Uncharacterized protein n=1 Tax=Anaeromonas frigoriresistens TaxID=2683708 RepID=A0A942UYR2_9FIRM|nr:hypothetical protein [Anaeromonas frigoriresistens]MBS4539456.1 hypothetical protein [Anaeromonas frigoriresistens]